MQEVRAEIYIESTAEWVWRVLTHFEAYPQWNPLIRWMERTPLAPGSCPAMQVQWPGEPVRTTRPMLTNVTPAAELRWQDTGWRTRFFACEQRCIIEPRRTGVRIVQSLRFSGWLAPLLAASRVDRVRQGLEAMNTSLKKVAEARKQ